MITQKLIQSKISGWYKKAQQAVNKTWHQKKVIFFDNTPGPETFQKLDPVVNEINKSKYPFGTIAIERTKDDNDLQNAFKEASSIYKTFDGNIKRVEEEECEQFFVFTKVRQ